MSRPRRRRLIGGLLLALTLSSCSSTTDGRPSTADNSKTSLPAKAWNQQVFLCASLSASPCHGETTAAQLSTVRAQLAADPAVTHIEFLSERDVFAVARSVLPASERAVLRLGYLPAEFLVSTSNDTTLSSTYATDPGVSAVVGCPVANRCAVSTLRAAGVVH